MTATWMTATWRDLAVRFPEWVQWIVQTYGPLPEGPVEEADYERFAEVWTKEQEQR